MSPDSIAKMFGDLKNAKVIAEEFNNLLTYFKQREELIGKEHENLDEYAGFILASILTALAMIILEGTGDKISSDILFLSRGLKEMPGSGEIKLKKKKNYKN